MIDEDRLRAGAKLYEQYYVAMIRRARRYVSDIYDAEDIVSNCWLRLLSKVNVLIEMDEPARSAYLMTAVQNESIDYHRKKIRFHSVAVELSEDIADSKANEAYDALVIGDTLTSLLTMIPPQEARIVRYKLKGISNAEIAELLSISRSTVRVYWQRARIRLRQIVQILGE